MGYVMEPMKHEAILPRGKANRLSVNLRNLSRLPFSNANLHSMLFLLCINSILFKFRATDKKIEKMNEREFSWHLTNLFMPYGAGGARAVETVHRNLLTHFNLMNKAFSKHTRLVVIIDDLVEHIAKGSSFFEALSGSHERLSAIDKTSIFSVPFLHSGRHFEENDLPDNKTDKNSPVSSIELANRIIADVEADPDSRNPIEREWAHRTALAHEIDLRAPDPTVISGGVSREDLNFAQHVVNMNDGDPDIYDRGTVHWAQDTIKQHEIDTD
jgi:hypothetical protein